LPLAREIAETANIKAISPAAFTQSGTTGVAGQRANGQTLAVPIIALTPLGFKDRTSVWR